jgi:hypothetical protein
VVVLPKARNDHRLPSAIPPGLEPWELVHAEPLSWDVWHVIFLGSEGHEFKSHRPDHFKIQENQYHDAFAESKPTCHAPPKLHRVQQVADLRTVYTTIGAESWRQLTTESSRESNESIHLP